MTAERSLSILTDPDNVDAVEAIRDALLVRYSTAQPIAFYVDAWTVVFLVA